MWYELGYFPNLGFLPFIDNKKVGELQEQTCRRNVQKHVVKNKIWRRLKRLCKFLGYF
jgi:hypothetical protein